MNEFGIYNFALHGLSPREKCSQKMTLINYQQIIYPITEENKKTLLRSTKFDEKHLIENQWK